MHISRDSRIKLSSSFLTEGQTNLARFLKQARILQEVKIRTSEDTSRQNPPQEVRRPTITSYCMAVIGEENNIAQLANKNVSDDSIHPSIDDRSPVASNNAPLPIKRYIS